MRNILAVKDTRLSEPTTPAFDPRSPSPPVELTNSLAETEEIASGQHQPPIDPVIGPYKLQRLIGEGGMGEVWLAEQESPIRRRVALKLIKSGLDSREVIARFESERQALALMDHPAIAKMFDAGTTANGRPYFGMEFVPGVDICTYCDTHRLTVRERLELFVKVCHGVQHAHRKAVIHRDLKPSNILVCEVDGKAVPKIIDFGVAKAISQQLTPKALFTRVGAVIGTVEYMSPEQLNSGGEDIDTRTDVFSLGVVLYQLLSGHIPVEYRKLALAEIVRAMREQETPRPSTKLRTTSIDRASTVAKNRRTEPNTLLHQLRGDLDAIALKALENDRSRRYGAPSDLAADIDRYLTDQPILARPAGFLYRSRKVFVRNRVAALSVASLMILLVGFAVTEAVQLRRIVEERNRSDRTVQFITDMFRVPHHGMGPGLSITAEEILDKATKDVQSNFGREPVTQARLKEALGLIYFNLGGSHTRGQTLVGEAVRILTKVNGKEDRETLQATRVLAVMGRPGDGPQERSESQETLRETLQIERRALGSTDPETLKTMHALARSSDKIGESEALMREALNARRRVLGPDDPTTLATMLDLVRLLNAEQKSAEAEGLSRELVDTSRRTLREEDERVYAAVWMLAQTLDQEKKYPEAEQVGRELDELEDRFPPDDKMALFKAKRFLVHVLVRKGNYAGAEVLSRQLLTLERAAFGLNHHRVGTALYNLACIAALSHQTDKAFSFLGEAFQHGFSSSDLEILAKDTDLDSIRSDSRYGALLIRVKQGKSASIPTIHSQPEKSRPSATPH